MALEKMRRSWEAALNPSCELSTDSLLHHHVAGLAVWCGWRIVGDVCAARGGGGWWLLGAALMIALAMLFDGLDGSLARAKGEVTRWGDYLDHTIDRILDATWVVCISASVFVADMTLGLAAAFFTLLGSYMGTQAQAVAGTRNYRGFSRADRTVLTLLSLIIMGVMLLGGWEMSMTYPSVFDHIAVNPLSLIVFISGIGGIWTFLVRFVQARGDILALDASDPLPQPMLQKGDESAE